MAGSFAPPATDFAIEVSRGLTNFPKRIAPRYFYDELGSALFEAITVVPEYGLTRADERLLTAHAASIARCAGKVDIFAELGSGSGRKTGNVIAAFAQRSESTYYPIDVSPSALAFCETQLQPIIRVQPICSDWLDGLEAIGRSRNSGTRMLLMFLGSSVGNIERRDIPAFLSDIRYQLRAGDLLLLGADLVQDVATMVAAYDDPTGVTAAFNLNLLGRINRELGGEFDMRLFKHDARWNANARAVEMHLVSTCTQDVYVGAVGTTVHFDEGESVWTESSHKFEVAELEDYASESGFTPVARWVDTKWPFAELLWAVPESRS